MTLKALIFDVDGTLAETEEAHRTAFNTSFESWGLDWHWNRETYRQLLKTTGGKERMAAFQKWPESGSSRLTPEDIANLHKDKTKNYAEILAKGDLSLRKGVAELIDAARKAGLKLAIATTTNAPNIEALCQSCWQCAASDMFDVIAAGDEVAAKKPAPDVFLLALKRLGLPADVCLAFEDSLNGVHSAKAAGLEVIITPSAYTDHQNFTGHGHIAPDLSRANLPQALSQAVWLQ